MLSMSILSSEISGSRHVFSGLRKIKEVTFFKRNLCETGQMGKWVPQVGLITRLSMVKLNQTTV